MGRNRRSCTTVTSKNRCQKGQKKTRKKNYGLGNIKATSINLMVAIEGRELAKLKHQDRTPRTQTAHSLYVFARTGSRERAVHSFAGTGWAGMAVHDSNPVHALTSIRQRIVDVT
jgi:hypothetical protein